ncbi:hypothetical protein BOX15_Mlig002074g2 [Macrostomum lignano]|uniref:Uncharacterized protein n=1 Tax=Macrostomum lignano TaxID=282301 RepID=A0A267GXC5_9PLAT|nr:hypothetical protein BOX15_Mlig002074g2 [Macrostomum lignano]
MHHSRPPKRADRSSSDERERRRPRPAFCSAYQGPAIGAAAGQIEGAPRLAAAPRVHPRLRLGLQDRGRSQTPRPGHRSPPPERQDPAPARTRRPRRRRGRRAVAPAQEVIDLTRDSPPQVRRLRDPGPSSDGPATRHLQANSPAVLRTKFLKQAPNDLPQPAISGMPRVSSPAVLSERRPSAADPTAGERLEDLDSSSDSIRPAPEASEPPSETAAVTAEPTLTPANRSPPPVDMATQTSEADIWSDDEATYSWSQLAAELQQALPVAPPPSPAVPPPVENAEAQTDTSLDPQEVLPTSATLVQDAAADLAGYLIRAARTGEWPAFDDVFWPFLRAAPDRIRQAVLDMAAEIAAPGLAAAPHPMTARAVARQMAREMAGHPPTVPEALARLGRPAGEDPHGL